LERSFILVSQQVLIKVTVVLLFLFIFPNLSQADHGREDLTQAIDGYQVELMFAAGQPQTGSNELAIQLHNPHGQPLANAIVTVSVARPEPVDTRPHQEADGDEHDQRQMSDPHGAEANEHGQIAAPEAHRSEHVEPGHNNPASNDHAQMDSTDHAEPAHGNSAHGELAEVALLASPTAGEYTGQVNFSDTGQWHLKVHFEVEGETKEAAFIVETTQNTSRWLVISGFLGLNALVILAAALTKRNYANTQKGRGIA
jgi:hypothetical protein